MAHKFVGKNWNKEITLVTEVMRKLGAPTTAADIGTRAFSNGSQDRLRWANYTGRVLRIMEDQGLAERTTVKAPHLWRLKAHEPSDEAQAQLIAEDA